MADLSRILIAVTDGEFRDAATDLLRSHGYRCNRAQEARVVRKSLGTNDYELLLTEPAFPGNKNLELVRLLSETTPGAQAILVAPCFEARTVMGCLELPVAACLEMPVGPDRLLSCVEAAVRRASACRAVHALHERLGRWLDQLSPIEHTLDEGRADDVGITTSVFVDLTFQSIVGALTDIRRLTEGLAGVGIQGDPCHLLGCPRVESLTEALLETVRVLEETKGAFKSKRLGQLRHKIAERLQQPEMDASSDQPVRAPSGR